VRDFLIPKEFLGAFKAGHRPSARGYIDDELSYELLAKVLNDGCEKSRSLLAYITKFNNEYYKNVIKKGDESALHASDELRGDCYARNNARSRDLFNKAKSIDKAPETFFERINQRF